MCVCVGGWVGVGVYICLVFVYMWRLEVDTGYTLGIFIDYSPIIYWCRCSYLNLVLDHLANLANQDPLGILSLYRLGTGITGQLQYCLTSICVLGTQALVLIPVLQMLTT